MSHRKYITLDQRDALDRDVFEAALLVAAKSSLPSYICDIHHHADLVPFWCAEGRQRAQENAEVRGKDWKPQDQHTPGQSFTADEIDRIAEGPIELMLGLDVAAVLKGQTDARPDRTLDGIRFDVKGAENRPDNTFSLPVWKVQKKEYDALILVRYLSPGHVRVWACRCTPSKPAWCEMDGVRGKGAFYKVSCPDGLTEHRQKKSPPGALFIQLARRRYPRFHQKLRPR